MSECRSYLIIGILVFVVAMLMRVIPLYWSPLPHVFDGFTVANLTHETIATGQIPISTEFRADLFIITSLTASASLVLGKAPLYTVQPMMSIVGATIPLVGMAFTRRFGADLGWSTFKVKVAVLACGLLLAVQGLFLRHTSIPDPEPIGQLFAFLAALALHQLLLRRRSGRWAVPLVALLVLFPMTHTFSTLNAALGLTGVATAVVASRPTKRILGISGGVVGGFWTLVFGYYELVGRTGVLNVAYIGRVRSHPGLFVAWVIVLMIGVVWYQQTTTRLRRLLFVGPFALLFGLVGVNIVRPVFPGTIQSPPEVMVLVSFLIVPVAFVGYGLFALSQQYETASLITPLLAGPLVIIYFSLSATLTPDFFGTATRGQAFLHVPAFVLVGLAVASVAWRSSGVTAYRFVTIAVIGTLAVSTVATVPIAFVALDTLEYPSTTHESEFAAIGHTATHTEASWTTDDGPIRVGRSMFGANVEVGPTRMWLRGGPPPDCTMLSFDEWTITGATFFPAGPASINRARYDLTLTKRNIIYTVNGRESIALSVPPGASGQGC